MSKRKNRLVETSDAPAHGEVKLAETGEFRMRLPAGKYACSAAEAEIHVAGVRVAGGNGSFEFDLAQETWVEIVIRRS